MSTDNFSERFSAWKSQVQTDLSKFMDLLESNADALQMTKGFEVWDSPVMYRPKLMFMGINPGTGNSAMKTAINVEPGLRISYLDYHDVEHPDNHYSYPLANTTFKILLSLGFSDLEARAFLNSSVKTNFFYIATAKYADIAKCLKKVSTDFYSEYMKWQYNTNIEMYDIIQPEIILCEGKMAFDHVHESFFGEEMNFPFGNDQLYFTVKNTKVVGYRRVVSSISDDELSVVANLLKAAGLTG